MDQNRVDIVVIMGFAVLDSYESRVVVRVMPLFSIDSEHWIKLLLLYIIWTTTVFILNRTT